MQTDFTELTERLKERAGNPKRAIWMYETIEFAPGDLEKLHQSLLDPPVTSQEFKLAEQALGFELPQLLKEIYLKVGNGGFGPGYGLMKLNITTEEKESIVSSYLTHRSVENSEWPEQLILICNWGCAIYSCLDCSKPDAPVIRYDPPLGGLEEDLLEQGIEFKPEDLLVLQPENLSFQEWLEMWLDGEGEALWTMGR